MNNKYLPIGTVCKIQDTDHKVMIVGYFYKNNGSEKIYDYCACPHPEGLMANSNKYLFDHNQIEQVFSLGYMNEAAIEYNEALKGLISQDSQATLTNLQFNADGIVIAEGNEVFSTETAPKISFNANGIVVADGDEVLTVEPVNIPAEQISGLQFNENGVVIGDDVANTQPQSQGLQFDANGVVIGDDVANTQPQSQGLQFDANGVVIGDDVTNTQPQSQGIQFNEAGIVVIDDNVSLPAVQFDANGVVISE